MHLGALVAVLGLGGLAAEVDDLDDPAVTAVGEDIEHRRAPTATIHENLVRLVLDDGRLELVRHADRRAILKALINLPSHAAAPHGHEDVPVAALDVLGVGLGGRAGQLLGRGVLGILAAALPSPRPRR